MIFLTNDDGVTSPGLRALAEVAVAYDEVVVVAPDGPYSGKSHSFTVCDELRVRRCGGFAAGVRSWAVRGTPVDCVKLGIFGFCGERPRLLLSGINLGSNTSISVHYSGTVGAAREGALIGVQSLAVSLADDSPGADFGEAQRVVDGLIRRALEGELTSKLLNVNVPAGRVEDIRPARLAPGRWIERPEHLRSPYGQDLYWLTGHFENDAPDDATTDEWLIHHHVAAITPLLIDVADYKAGDVSLIPNP